MSNRLAVMRGGHIEQLGAPEDVYENPATEFVAGFLGVSNLLDGEVAGREGSFTTIRLHDGALVRAPSSAVNGASSVRIGVRPEKLRVVNLVEGAEPAGTELNALDGVVLDASYIGVSTQYLVETRDGRHLTIYAQNLETTGAHEALADGQAVRITWKPQHTFVIGRTQADAEGATDV